MSLVSKSVAAATLMFALVSMVTSLEAAPNCKNGMQFVGGSWLATPYCQDALLGDVAREHGMKVSDSAVRQNPNVKRDVCRFVGQDIRVRETCFNENRERRGL